MVSCRVVSWESQAKTNARVFSTARSCAMAACLELSARLLACLLLSSSCFIFLVQCHLAPSSVTDDVGFTALFGTKYFVGFCSDGTEVELVPGGRSIPVTFATRLKYCALLEKLRLYVRACVACSEVAVCARRNRCEGASPFRLSACRVCFLSPFAGVSKPAGICGADRRHSSWLDVRGAYACPASVHCTRIGGKCSAARAARAARAAAPSLTLTLCPVR